MYRYERSRGQIVESERRPHRSRSMSKGRSRSYSRTRGRSRSITRMSRAGSVQNLECCSPRRKAGFFICGLLLLLLIFGAIGSIVVLVRSPGQASVKTIDQQPKEPITPNNNNHIEPKPEPKNIEENVVGPPKPKQEESEIVSKIKAIVSKLKELGLRVDEDTSISGPKLPSENYDDITEVSDSESIKISEIAVILDKFKDANPKLSLAEEADAIKKFKINMKKYNRTYVHLNHLLERYGYFRINYKEIEKHNKNPKYTYKKGYNEFTTFSQAELGNERKFGYMRNSALNDKIPYFKSLKQPLLRLDGKTSTNFDWRSEDVISSVMDQGDCGSCWAFSVAGAIDAAYNIKHKGQHVQTSPQHLINCLGGGKYKCKGAPISESFEFAKENGICLASDLPYANKHDSCDESKCKDRIKITKYYRVEEDKLEDVVRHQGPVVVTMDTRLDFLFYESGVFNGSCKDEFLHAVLLVGYGYDESSKQRYWILKNSWGTDWGEEGYIKVSRDTDKGDSYCAINKDVYVPVI